MSDVGYIQLRRKGPNGVVIHARVLERYPVVHQDPVQSYTLHVRYANRSFD